MERLLFIIKTYEGMIYMNYWYEMTLRPVSFGWRLRIQLLSSSAIQVNN